MGSDLDIRWTGLRLLVYHGGIATSSLTSVAFRNTDKKVAAFEAELVGAVSSSGPIYLPPNNTLFPGQWLKGWLLGIISSSLASVNNSMDPCHGDHGSVAMASGNMVALGIWYLVSIIGVLDVPLGNIQCQHPDLR